MRIVSISASSPEACYHQPRWLFLIIGRYHKTPDFLFSIFNFLQPFLSAASPGVPPWRSFYLWGDHRYDWRISDGSGFGLCHCAGVKAKYPKIQEKPVYIIHCISSVAQHLDLFRITTFQYRLGPFGFLSTGDSEAPGLSQSQIFDHTDHTDHSLAYGDFQSH